MTNLNSSLLGKFSGLIEARKLIKSFLKDNKDAHNYDKIMQVSNEIKNIINTSVVVNDFQTTKTIRVLAHKRMNNKFLCRDFIKSLGTMTYTYVGDFDERRIIVLEDDEHSIEDIKYHFPVSQNPNDFEVVKLIIDKGIRVVK